jgi:hypothetical protein
MGGINLPSGEILNFNDTDDLSKMAQILLDENYKSVNHRYKENDSDTINFEFEPALSCVQIIKACECYDYQACETKEYKDSAAKRIIEWIEGKAVRTLPGYESAEWEIN